METIINQRCIEADLHAIRTCEQSGFVEVHSMLVSRPWYQNKYNPEAVLRGDYAKLLKGIQMRQREQGLDEREFPTFENWQRVPVKVQDVFSAVSQLLATSYLSVHPDYPNTKVIGSYKVENVMRHIVPSFGGPDIQFVAGGFVLGEEEDLSSPLFGLPDMFLVRENAPLACVDFSTKIRTLTKRNNRKRMQAIERTFSDPDAFLFLRTAIAELGQTACYGEPGEFQQNTVVVAMEAPHRDVLQQIGSELYYGQIAPCGVRGRSYMALQAIRDLAS